MTVLTLARRIRDGETLPQRCQEHKEYAAGCAACRQAAATRARARYRASSYGWLPAARISADDARQHITTLHEQHGMSLALIAGEAGVAFSTVRNISVGVTVESKPTTVYAILAVRPVPAPLPHGLTWSAGAARRLQSLALGFYSSEEVAPMLGTIPEVVRRWRIRKTPMITVEWHDAIADLTRTLDGARGDNRRAHNYAVRQGWVPLAAWDDIDDPEATPFTDCGDGSDIVDDIAIELALNGHLVRLTSLEKRHAVHRGLAAGMGLTSIAKALRMSGGNVNYLAHKALPEPAAA